LTRRAPCRSAWAPPWIRRSSFCIKRCTPAS